MKKLSNFNTTPSSAVPKYNGMYEKLAVFNREYKGELKVASLIESDQRDLRQYLDKQAEGLTTGDRMKKEAFLSGGMELFLSTKSLLMQQLGMDEAKSHEMASTIVTKANQIVEQYGGELGVVIERLVEEMKNQLATQQQANPDVLMESKELLLLPRSTKHIHEFTKKNLIQTMRLNNYEAERLAKTIVQESRDLLISLRPYTLPQVVDAMVQMMAHYGDTTVAYNLKSDPYLLQELRDGLSSMEL